MAYKVKDKVKFLSDASKILASSLDYNITLGNVARLAVTYISDFCVIDLFEKDTKLHRVTVRTDSSDPYRKKLVLEVFRFPPDPRNKRGIYDAARTGKPVLVKRFTERWQKGASRISEEHKLVRKLGMRSFMFVPLKSRNKIIGVLTLITSGKKFSYTEADVVLAQELANRAGMAVDNALLFMETQEALRLRDLFIAMAAHELRTPLTTISGYIQLLHQKFKGVQTQEGRWVEDLVYESSRLTKLVNELLEVNRIKIGKFEFVWQECSLNAVIMRAIAEFHFTHPKREVIFQSKVAEDKDMVIGDFNKLLQLLVNLLDNAAKFSAPDSEISLGLDSKNKYFCLIVSDQGRGIAKRDLPGIFEKFHKGSDHTKEGIGLGLFLARIITSEHRGEIEIESEVNKGTEVRVLLPKIGNKKN